ncbi:hypothetical protein C1Y30_26735 [Pseudomonas sp. GW704-F3]|nr:hypothetical protein C1Y30_26735 [Pseudomonas sp. GW704-F3]PMU89841.1 hypothetical protein C1Y28_26005 [Pseudomonas sp. GW704-F5]PMU99538.1 hypothetical protein C1Y29_24840 [Pseudomonas sp. MPBD4-3]PMV22424.1 hypothetical protein C1Y27_26775 [Pseudomonas sp. GW704-F2]
MLAKSVYDNAGSLEPRVVLWFFASKLAPTGFTIDAPDQEYPCADSSRFPRSRPYGGRHRQVRDVPRGGG